MELNLGSLKLVLDFQRKKQATLAQLAAKRLGLGCCESVSMCLYNNYSCCPGELGVMRQSFSMFNAGKRWWNLWSLKINTSCPTLNFSRSFCWISALTHEAAWALLKQPRSHAAVSHHPSARDVSHLESLLKARLKFYIRYLNHLSFVNKWDLGRRDVKQQINKAATDFWWTKD